MKDADQGVHRPLTEEAGNETSCLMQPSGQPRSRCDLRQVAEALEERPRGVRSWGGADGDAC